MMKKKVILSIDYDKWEFLKPILEPFRVDEEEHLADNTLIDFDVIRSLPQGIRIANILKDGRWTSGYSFDFTTWDGKDMYSVMTIGDLKKITPIEFLKHRNAGRKSWDSLKDYIATL